MQIGAWQVLIVEDDADSMDLIQTVLGHGGVPYRGARTAEEALAILQEFTPDVFIIDLHLPKMDGWSFLQVIRQVPALHNAPKVAITGYFNPILVSKAIEAGFDAFMPKPIDARLLVQHLTEILDKKHQPDG